MQSTCIQGGGAGARAVADALLEFDLGPHELYNLRHSAHWLDERLCNPALAKSSAAALDMMKSICRTTSCFWGRAQPIPVTTPEFLMAHAIYAFPGIYFIDTGPSGIEREKMNVIQPRLYIAAKEMLLLFYDILYSLSSGKSTSHMRRVYGKAMRERMRTYHSTWTQARIVGEIVDLKKLLVSLNESASPSEADDESASGVDARDQSRH